MTMFTQTTATNLMTDIDKRFDPIAIQSPVRYISADEMAYLRARAVTLRREASLVVFNTVGAKLAGLFRSRAAEWSPPAGTVSAK